MNILALLSSAILLSDSPQVTAAGRSRIAGIVREAQTMTPLPGANVVVAGTGRGASAGPDGGFLIDRLDSGRHTLRVSLIGYSTVESDIRVGPDDSLFLTFELTPEEIETEIVVITGTRLLRSVADVPVRVEAIPEEEVEEKLLMTPSNVAMLLNESAGMRVQTTSAAASSSNLRIYGQSGSYTQILNDGIPTLGGMSAGLSLTQLMPLDLRQVEVLKGATSALYGSDAIGGVVNFLPKLPGDPAELSLLTNATTQKGFDAAGYFSGRIGGEERTGASVLASHNRQQRYDVDGDGFADVAEFVRTTVTPRILHSFTDDVSLKASVTIMGEDRVGGAMESVPAGPSGESPYTETIETGRLEASAQLDVRTEEDRYLSLKLAGLGSERDALYGSNPFAGTQTVWYGDAQYPLFLSDHTLLVGASWRYDDYEDRAATSSTDYSYRYVVGSMFIQDEVRFDPVTILAGARLDFHNTYGTIVVPRLSLMYRPDHSWTFRIGGGTGYRAPTIFVEEAEEVGFRNVHPLGGVLAEKARSASFDANWRTIAGPFTIDVNSALFYSTLDDALIADEDSLASDVVYLRNADGPRTATGGEATFRLTWEDFKASIGYTYLYSTQEDRGESSEADLNPRHALGIVLFYENHEEQLKIGLENYYTGRQRVERNPFRETTPEYWITGLLAEKGFGHFRLYINFENIFDTRQTNYEPIWVGDLYSLRTLPVYAPLEGRVINGGVRYVLRAEE